jgi:hypothetical protein
MLGSTSARGVSHSPADSIPDNECNHFDYGEKNHGLARSIDEIAAAIAR